MLTDYVAYDFIHTMLYRIYVRVWDFSTEQSANTEASYNLQRRSKLYLNIMTKNKIQKHGIDRMT